MISLWRRFSRIRESQVSFPVAVNFGNLASRENQTASSSSSSLRFKPDKGLIISENCAKRVREIAEDEQFLRIQVESGGCQGFSYKFQLDDKLNDDDVIFENNGSKVVVDATSLDLISGSMVDYSQELIRSSFRIVNNPKSVQGCSCGSSFSVQLE